VSLYPLIVIYTYIPYIIGIHDFGLNFSFSVIFSNKFDYKNVVLSVFLKKD